MQVTCRLSFTLDSNLAVLLDAEQVLCCKASVVVQCVKSLTHVADHMRICSVVLNQAIRQLGTLQCKPGGCAARHLTSKPVL